MIVPRCPDLTTIGHTVSTTDDTAYPPGITAGDLLLMIVTFGGVGGVNENPPALAGFDEMAYTWHTYWDATTFARVADGTESGTITPVKPGGYHFTFRCLAVLRQNTGPVTVEHVLDYVGPPDVESVTVPSLDLDRGGMLVAFSGVWGDNNYAEPSPAWCHIDHDDGDSFTGGWSFNVACATPGPTGDLVFTNPTGFVRPDWYVHLLHVPYVTCPSGGPTVGTLGFSV